MKYNHIDFHQVATAYSVIYFALSRLLPVLLGIASASDGLSVRLCVTLYIHCCIRIIDVHSK